MATLQKIRSKAGLLALIIGFALFAFIIGDFLNSGSSLFRQSQQKIAKIGDTSLDYKEYEARIAQMEEVYKVQTGQNNLDEAITGQIRESVFETIVRERLLDEQAALLGVSVSGKEVFNMINGVNVHPMIQQLPIFQNPQTGGFDRSIMLNFLQTIQKEDLSKYPEEAQEQIKQLKNYWMFWENNLKYTRLEEKMNTLLAKAVQANSLDAKASFADRSTSVDFDYVFEPFTSLPDSLFNVSKSDIKKRYNTQKERFVQKPFRTAKYVLVNEEPSKEDFKTVETSINNIQAEFAQTADLENFVNDNSDNAFVDCYIANRVFDPTIKSFVESSANGSFLKPVYKDGAFIMARLLDKTVASDSVKARQIVLGPNDQALADSLLAVIRKGGNFAQLASKYSRGGNPEMGWFREIDAAGLGANFVRSCFGAAVNTPFSVKTKNSLNIVEVTAKTAPISKSKVAIVYMKVTPSSSTYSAVYNKLNRLVAKNQEADAFFAAAEKAGYNVQLAQTVRETDNTLAQIPQMRQAVRFIYENSLGDVSSILENQSNQFVVVGVTGISKGDYQSVESVSQVLQRELINEQKANKIADNMKAKNKNTLASLAQASGLSVDTARFVNFSINRITGIGEEPALISAVTVAPVSKMSEPVKGKNGVYVFNVASKTKSQEVFNLNQEKASWNASNMYRLMYQSMAAVRKAAKIKDSRIRFY
jgi:peptidyl-prolyl cis-trans isomerase D